MSKQLADIEAIKQLKARYCRAVDEHDWAHLRTLFTADAVFETDEGAVIDGAEVITEFVKERLDKARTVHLAVLPEIAISGDTATGVWAMTDYVTRSAATRLPSFRGYGHYYEAYRRVGGQWLISSVRLTRTRVDPLPPEEKAARGTAG